MLGTYIDIEALKPDIKRLITALRATESIEVACHAVVQIFPAMLILRQLTLRFPDPGTIFSADIAFSSSLDLSADIFLVATRQGGAILPPPTISTPSCMALNSHPRPFLSGWV